MWAKIRILLRDILRRSPFYPFPPPHYIQQLYFWREVRRLPMDRFREVLDAGMGPGHYTRQIAKKYPHCQVTGYDLQIKKSITMSGVANLKMHILNYKI